MIPVQGWKQCTCKQMQVCRCCCIFGERYLVFTPHIIRMIQEHLCWVIISTHKDMCLCLQKWDICFQLLVNTSARLSGVRLQKLLLKPSNWDISNINDKLNSYPAERFNVDCLLTKFYCFVFFYIVVYALRGCNTFIALNARMYSRSWMENQAKKFFCLLRLQAGYFQVLDL